LVVLTTVAIGVAAACSSGPEDLEIAQVLVSANGQHLEVLADDCTTEPITGQIVEQEDSVEITLRGEPVDDADDCAESIEFDLESPLNGRPIIDGASDQGLPPSEIFGN